MSASLHITVYNWLKELKIPVSKSYIKKQLLSHPDYPSLLGITDTLDELGIENTAVQIEKEQLVELPTPFIAHLNGNGGEFAIIKEKENTDKKIPDFFNRWNGVVVVAEKSEGWKHTQNNEWLKKDKKSFLARTAILSILALFIISSIFYSFSGLFTGLLLIAVSGIFISWMIVSKDLGIENKIADELCGANADCNSVIHSKVIKLPFNIGWSDAGIIYFSFLLIILLFGSFNDSLTGLYPVISIIAFAAIPVTVISIYYQWRVIKKWCRLCLFTSALLWLQFLLLLPVGVDMLRIDFDNLVINSVFISSFAITIVAAGWLWLKPLIIKNKELKAENFAAERFRRNVGVFTAILEKQKKITVQPEGLGIIIGNPHAKNTIIKVCNPYCGPCAAAHPVIDKLLEENKNLKVQIIFTAGDDDKNIRAKSVKHLMALNEKNNKQLIQRALDDWYMADKKDYDSFALKYVLNGELENQGDKLKSMKSWCDEVKIEFTPTFFVNGYQLPKQYTIEDVKYFLE